MKNMRPVFMDQYSIVIKTVVCIAADVRSFITNKNALPGSVRQAFRENTARETGSYN
jgi:hypothetical protein